MDKSTCAQTPPNEENVGLEITLVFTDHVRCDNGNDGIPEPVGGSREGDTTGTDGDWEGLTNDDPNTWTPGRGEEEDVDADEGNLGIDSRNVVGSSVAIGA